MRRVEHAVALIIIGGAAAYLWAHRDEFTAVLDIPHGRALAIAAGVVVSLLASSVQNYVMLRAENVQIGFLENFMLSLAGNLGNYLPMRAGTLVRLRYLKSKHGLRYARFGSIFGIRTVLILLATGVLGTAGTLGLWHSGRPLSLQLLTIFGTLVCVAGYFTLRPPSRRLSGSGRIAKAANDFAEGFETIHSRPGVSLQVSAFLLVQFLALGWRFLLTFEAIGLEPSPYLLLLLSPLATLVSFVAITPGALGLREAVMGYAALVTGIGFDSGFFAGAVDRAVMLVILCALGAPSLVFCWRRMNRAEDDAGPQG
jgi:uncharacterized membrane protein YbhN (UPF0104 family)